MLQPTIEIPLNAWATARWRPVPSIQALRRWAKNGHIFPVPRMVGRMLMVQEDAIYVHKPEKIMGRIPGQLRLVA